MGLLDFLTRSETTGRRSSHKAWRNIAYATVTGILAADWQHPDPWLVAVYLAVVAGSEVAKRAVEWRFKPQQPAGGS